MELAEYLTPHGIRLCGVLPLSECTIQKPYLLARAGFAENNFEKLQVLLFAVPYLTPDAESADANVSAYAAPRDYHIFFQELFNDVLPKMRKDFPKHLFAGFADHSPILEVPAAAAAGLGVIGCHHLLLTRRYSSYIFLGEIITDLPLSPTHSPLSPSQRVCHKCGACQKACPALHDGCSCYSALTQSKKLSSSDETLLRQFPLLWGCDQCQRVCPYTHAAKNCGTIYTDIPYFTEKLIPRLTLELLNVMRDEDFSERAYAWRGREVIRRNLLLKASVQADIQNEKLTKGESSCSN